jgi:LysM repeat protein
MDPRARALVVAAFAAGPLLLVAGCGDSTASGSRSTLTPIQGSSYVTIVPATTTTTTTLAPEQIAATGISPTEQTYTVQGGDSISRIASIHDITMDVLVNYNGWTDGLNHFLGVGDTVLIPPGSKIPGAAPASSGDEVATGNDTTAEEPAATGEGCQHTIVEGDNPTRVAAKYGITVDELANANLNNPVWNTFLIGSQLTIPPGGDC